MQVTDKKYSVEKIFDVVFAFNNEQDAVKLLNVILDKMMEITNSDAGTLYMIEDGALHFRILKNNSLKVYQTVEAAINLPPVVMDKNNIVNVCAYTALKNEIVSIDDVYTSDQFNFSGPKNYDQITGYRSQSFLSLPLTATLDENNEVLGVLQLINATDPETGQVIPYGDVYDPPVLPALSNIAANILANLMYLREIHQLFHSFVGVMTQAIDERSPYNRHHTQNVSRYCNAFAVYLCRRFPPGHALHFDDERRNQLEMAALLHDIGKIITPLNIMDKADRLGERAAPLKYRFEIKKHQTEIEYLKGNITAEEYERQKKETARAVELIDACNTALFLTDANVAEVKALAGIKFINAAGNEAPLLESLDVDALTVRKGTLTDAERKIMEEHVSLTGRLLEKMEFKKYYREVPGWAKAHHEFLNGTGYPLGLTEESITVEVCIITIMDIFDALVANDRPYKKGMPTDKALEILQGMADEGKLHKELVGLFIESEVWND